MARPIDLLHLGNDRVICAWLAGDVVVDPGPESCLEALLEGLGDVEPRALALTHIHLDHAGASGALARRFPDLEVWVHERGAPHMADPSKLLASAARLYGDDMTRLWGAVLPVAPERLRVLRGGERLAGFEVVHTPGHASHHVAYLDADGTAFVGDLAGVRIPPCGHVEAPTPPPDIDLEAWRESVARVATWGPRRLALTHFGAVTDVAEHFDALLEALERSSATAPAIDAARFVETMQNRIASACDAQTGARFEQALPPRQSWLGLERYWAQRARG